MKISVVIPNWNGLKHLKRNLSFLLREKPYEVIVVDDFSSDESVSFLSREYPDIKLIINKKNLNFAKSVNQGVKNASGDLVCLLNTDVKPGKDFLKNSQKYFEDPFLFGISLHEEGRGPAVSSFVDGFIGYHPGQEINKPQSTFWISGGSCIFKKSTWTKLNGFDSDLFPFYWEDLDISYRAAKRGYRLLWVPDCCVVHEHETFYRKKFDAGSLAFTKETRQLLFIWKNLTDRGLFFQHLAGVVQRILKSPGYLKVVLAIIPKIPKVFISRMIETKEAVLSDKEVLANTSGKEY